MESPRSEPPSSLKTSNSEPGPEGGDVGGAGRPSPGSALSLAGLSQDSSLADLVERLTRKLEAGESIDVDEIAVGDSSQAELLRDLMPALRQLAKLGSVGGRTSGGSAGPGLTGRERLGEFQLLREIGRGGMGIVYEAVQESLGRRVALKVLANPAAASERALHRFRLEVQAAARLHHPNIVPVYVVGTEEGMPHYAMQLIDGRSLADVLRDLRRLEGSPRAAASAVEDTVADPLAARLLSDGFERGRPGSGPPTDVFAPLGPASGTGRSASARMADYYRAVARIGLQAADALECAHERGIIHRDIKPANLLLDRKGNAWITDFGLARIQGDDGITVTGEFVGTLRYMSPEQVAHKAGPVDGRTDVYSLGVTLYELLTLRPAFDDADPQRILRAVLEDDPPSIRSLAPAVPADLATVVSRAMAKEPRARYPSARQLAEDLGRFLDGRPVLARPARVWDRAWKRARRSPLATGLTLAVMALVVALGVQSRRRAVGEPAPEPRGASASLPGLEARRTSAALALDRGIGLAEDRRVARGLLWMRRCLELAPPEDPELVRAAETNLAAWGRLSPVPRVVFNCGRGASIKDMGLSPDGGRLAVVKEDGELSLWDMASGRPLRSVRTPHPRAWGCRFDGDGRFVLTGGHEDGVEVWEAETLRPSGGLIACADGTGWPIALKPGSPSFFSAEADGIVRLRSLATAEAIGPALLEPGRADTPCGVLVRPGGVQLLTYGGAEGARLWDLSTGRPKGKPLEKGALIPLASFSPDGRRLALVKTAELADSVVLCDPDEGRVVARTQPRPGGIKKLLFNPDGLRLASLTHRGAVHFVDPETGQTRDLSLTNGSSVIEAVYSPDGKFLVTGGDDGAVRFFEADSGRPYGPILEHPAPINWMAFGGDARTLVTATFDGTVRAWDIAPAFTAGRAVSLAAGVKGIDYSPDGRLVACGGADGVVRVLDTATGMPVLPPLLHASEVATVRFSPDGRLLATGGFDYVVRLWDVATGEPIGPPLPQPAWVMTLRFSPDGRRLLVGTTGGIARLWDLADFRPIGPLLPHPVCYGHEIRCCAFSSDGRVAITGTTLTQGKEATLGFWDARTGEALAPFARFDSSIVDLIVGPGPEGPALVLEGGRVHVIDLRTFREIRPPFGQNLVSIAPLPGARKVLAGASDRTARIWDVAEGRPEGPALDHVDPVYDVAVSRDGSTLLTLAGERLHFWSAATAMPLGPSLHHRRLRHEYRVDDRKLVGFGPDGRSAFSVGDTLILWDAPEPSSGSLPDLSRLTASLDSLTGMSLGEGGDVRMLDPAEWRARMEADDPALAVALPGAAEWHDRWGAESERLGRPFAAAWHFDRLVADRPGDWLVHARRAVSRMHAGDERGAAEDWAFVRAAGPPASVRAWEAFAAFDRMTVANAQGRRHEVVDSLRRLSGLLRDGANLSWRLAQAEAELGRYEAAEEALRSFLAATDRWPSRIPQVQEVQNIYAVLCIRDGHQPTYRDFCRRLRERAGEQPPLSIASALAWICSVAPGGFEDATMAGRLAEATSPKQKGDRRPDLLVMHGAALHRAGRFAEAIARLEEGERLSSLWRPQAQAFLAMANQSLGRAAEARRWLGRLQGRANSTDPKEMWNELEISVLAREAEAVVVLDPAFPAHPFAP